MDDQIMKRWRVSAQEFQQVAHRSNAFVMVFRILCSCLFTLCIACVRNAKNERRFRLWSVDRYAKGGGGDDDDDDDVDVGK